MSAQPPALRRATRWLALGLLANALVGVTLSLTWPRDTFVGGFASMFAWLLFAVLALFGQAFAFRWADRLDHHAHR